MTAFWSAALSGLEAETELTTRISYELNEEGIRISQDEQSVLNEWGDFRKAVSTGQSVILYVTKVRALIFPRESLGEQYAAAVQMISTHMPAKKVNIRHVSAN